MEEINPFKEALKQQHIKKGKNWMNKITQDLERLDTVDISKDGEENNRNA
jgi:hypothetical protein